MLTVEHLIVGGSCFLASQLFTFIKDWIKSKYSKGSTIDDNKNVVIHIHINESSTTEKQQPHVVRIDSKQTDKLL